MSHLVFSQKGRAGHILLNRPEALNALTIEMVTDLAAQLRLWAEDEAICHVIITSGEGRAFCAGGDVRQAVRVIAEEPDLGAKPYFQAEYGFDICLASFPKPVTCLVDGVVMGGGFGIARLSDFLVVSSRIKMAMPETAIGLFPDVGASHFLRRAPFEVALMLGMTGTIIGAGDAIAWGLADIHCQATEFEALFDALCLQTNEADIQSCLSRYHSAPPDKELALKSDMITDIFSQQSPSLIMAKAQKYEDDEFAQNWVKAFCQKCPTSISVFWHMMTKLPETRSVEEAIRRDFPLALKMTARPDFTEGVRAVLVEKDNKPKWQPASLSDVTDDMLAYVFDFDGAPPLPEDGFGPKNR